MKLDRSLAVIVVNWNGDSHLRACLQALRLQTYVAFRAIVVDNASTDGSERIVIEMHDPRFSLMQLPTNVGFAGANNAGVAQCADCDWIALLNPDAFPEPTWLAELLAATQTYPGAAGFGSHLIDAKLPSLSDGTGDSYHVSGRPFRRDHGTTVEASHRRPGPIFAPCAAAALYSRQAWQKVGGFDEDFFCYLEDVDLAFRLRLLGLDFRYVPTAICHHVGSAITGRRSNFSCYYGQRNLVWTYVKNMPGLLFWCFLPLHLLLNVVAVLLFAARGQLGTVLRAKYDALRAMPQTWRKRQLVHARRTASLAQIWAALDKRVWPSR